MNLKKSLGLVAVFVGVLMWAPLHAQATLFTWTGAKSSVWTEYTTSPTVVNWSGGSNGHRYPGEGTSYTDQATISSTTRNPVTLSTTILLGNTTSTETLTLSNSGNSLNINSGGTLGIRGGSTTTGISNAGSITINTGGILRNDAATALHYSIHGAGSITLAGGTISSQAAGGIWDFNQAVSGNGTISAPVDNYSTLKASTGTMNITGAFTNKSAGTLTVDATRTMNFGTATTAPTFSNSGAININGVFDNLGTAGLNLGSGVVMSGGTLQATGGQKYTVSSLSGDGTIKADVNNTGTLTASGAGKTLTVQGAVSHTGTTGDVVVGSGAADNVTLDLQNNLGAYNFTLNQRATLNQTAGTITLGGDFNNYATSTSQWQPAGGIALSMTGSTFEVAGKDYGAVSGGFNNNFNLASLFLPATAELELADSVDNGNRTGIHGVQEALYIYSLTGAKGAELDLNNIWCYVMKDGTPFALPDGYYGNVLVEGSPAAIPIPGSVLLLGSGLLGVGLLRFRRREKKS
jgi:hypothetical protein